MDDDHVERVEREIEAEAARVPVPKRRGRKPKEPPALSGSLIPSDATERRLPLRTARHARLEMARVYRAMRFGELDPAVGARLAYVLGNGLLKAIEVADLEHRLEELERQLAIRQPYERQTALPAPDSPGHNGGEEGPP